MNNFMFSNNSWPEEMQLKSSHLHSLEKTLQNWNK